MKKIYFIVLFLLCCHLGNTQTTYTWNVSSGDFLNPNSWTPARNLPDTNDILVFDGNSQALPTVNNISTQTIGKLIIKNNANVNFASAIAAIGIGKYEFGVFSRGAIGSQFLTQLKVNDIITDTLYSYGLNVTGILNDSTFYGEGLFENNFVLDTNFRSFYIQPKLIIKQKSSTTPSFEITQGAKLQINCSAPSLSIFIDSGAFAKINGNLDIAPIASTITCSMLSGIDSNAIQIKNNGKITSFQNQIVTMFRLINNRKVAIFDSGSVYEEKGITSFNINSYYNPVIFFSGSTFIYNGFDNSSIGHFYSNINFIYKNKTTSLDYGLIIVDCTFENLLIDSGNIQIKIWDNLTIKKNIIVKPLASLVFSSETNLTSNITLNGNTIQEIKGGGTIQIKSELPKRLDIILDNNSGLKLGNDLKIINGNLILKNGEFDLNNNNLILGIDSVNRGNILATNGYLKGIGIVTKWYPSNNAFTQNLDSNIFPFGFQNQKRSIWVVGNFTKSGTISIAHNNIEGMFSFVNSFNDSNTLVKNRQNYNWQIATANGLKSNNITIKAQGNLDSGYINLPTNIRLTLANGKAPGLAQNGTGTSTLPLATRTNLSEADINNTFFLGANSTICIPPPSPIANNAIICKGSSSELKAIGVGTISWYTDSIVGNYIKSGTSFNTPILNNLTTYYVQDSTCGASKRTKVDVTVLTKPSIGFTINNTSQCIDSNYFIFSDTTNLNSFNRIWYLDSTETSLLPSINKTYNTPNNHTIKLVVFSNDVNTCRDSLTKIIKINPTPTINASSTDTVICEGNTIKLFATGAKSYIWPEGIMNNTIFKPIISRNYIVKGIDSNNCSSFDSVFVKINPKPTLKITTNNNNVCAKTEITLTGNGAKNYIWNGGIVNGKAFKAMATSTYTLAGIDSNNCSDSASIVITVKPLPNVKVTQNKNILTAELNNANYQWFNCASQKNILGSVSQNFVASFNGNYAVIIQQNGCVDTSICLNVNSVGLLEKEVESLSIYPNPATSQINITSNSSIKTVIIYNLTGKLIKELTYENNNLKDVSLAIDELAQGMYMVQIIDELDAKLTSKFIKE